MVDERIIMLIKSQENQGIDLLKQNYSGLIHYIVRNILNNKEIIEAVSYTHLCTAKSVKVILKFLLTYFKLIYFVLLLKRLKPTPPPS